MNITEREDPMDEKVLLIDDEEDFLKILAERLEARDMKVDTASSAKEALSRIESESFDAIVLDLAMPEMDGIEALRAIREKRPEVQVILLTGHATVEKGVEAIKLGAMDFLEKPADLELLKEKIKAASAKKMMIIQEQSEARVKDIIKRFGF
ncbi:MAG: response regulator [Desulfobacterales bacterium]